VVIDRITNSTVGAGMILDRAAGDGRHDHWEAEPATAHLHGEASQVSLEERIRRFGQTPATILLTGLTGSGKTTIAFALERRLFAEGRAVTVLDGQNMRRGISRDLGFAADDRSENLRRSAEVARLFNDAGMICIAAFIAPDEGVRQKAAEVIGRDRFLTVHLDCPIEICRQRDPDGNYQLADSGEAGSFPGVSVPYEIPTAPDLKLPTHELSVEECVRRIAQLLTDRGMIH